MSDAEKRDHWADLAAVMGVTPAPAAPEKPAPAEKTPEPEAPAAEIPAPPPAVAAPEPVRAGVAPARKSADWDQLAASLGITPLPPPIRPEPAAVSPVPPVRHEEPAKPARHPSGAVKSMWEPVEPAKQETQPAAKPAEEHGEADQDAEGLFEADAPSPSEIWEEEIAECDDPILLDTTPEGVARDRAEESAADAAEEGERRPRRRRRRRGRGKGRRTEGQTEGRPNEPAAPGSAPTAGVETPASAENASSEELEVGVERVADAECIEEGLAGESAQPAGQEGERTSAEPRGRRRRSRRGQRRDERPRENRPEPAPASAESPAEEAEDDDADEPLSLNEDVLGEVGEEESGDELDADGESSKWAHRAIPTWEEAIGYVVGRNLESRAKNPNAGGPRNRGGQGRSRGGRRHD